MLNLTAQLYSYHWKLWFILKNPNQPWSNQRHLYSIHSDQQAKRNSKPYESSPSSPTMRPLKMWNRKTTVRLKNSVQFIVYTVPFHIWVDFECTGKICCFIPTLNTLINISSSYSTPSWVSLYVRKRYLSMVSWQNIEHSGGPGGAVFGTLYLLTVKKSSTCFIVLPP